MTAPLPVLLARLEHELEAARLAIKNTHYVHSRDAIERATEIAKTMREGI